MSNCKHGMDESSCAYCNGFYDKLMQDKQMKRKEREEITSERIRYEELKSKFENLNEDWDEDEYQVLYDQLNGLKFQSSKWRRAIYQTAIILGRTRRSIVWHWKHMFVLPDHSKAGKNLLKFKHQMKSGI